jgi:hypothetical protein
VAASALLGWALLASCSRSDEAADAGANTAVDLSVPVDASHLDDLAEPSGHDQSSLPDLAPARWRSALYPDSWTPGLTNTTGRFLHDFSYAGYHRGEVAPGSALPTQSFDPVALHGADPTGASDSTAALQATIDDAGAQGGIVQLPPGLYRVDGRLTVTRSRVVLRGAGAGQTRLYFTRTVDSDTSLNYGAHLSIHGTPTTSGNAPLAADAANRSTELSVSDASALAVGDHVALGWVVTPAFIADHGMTGTWSAFNGTWQPMAWRTLTAIDRTTTPARVTVDIPLRYPALVRDQASLRKATGWLEEVGIERLALSNASDVQAAWRGNQVHVLEFVGVRDGWVDSVESFAAPGAPSQTIGAKSYTAHLQSSGLLLLQTARVTVANSRLGYSINRGSGGNGYLFEVRQSSEVLFTDDVATFGRHNFIQNWGFGTTGCVWLRCTSQDGVAQDSLSNPLLRQTGMSEFHHSLAVANLIDSSTFTDGFAIVNRGTQSSGAGHTGTQNVLWNVDGAQSGVVRSLQFGTGYVIGTRGLSDLIVDPAAPLPSLLGWGAGTAPADWVEGHSDGARLEPQSLYEDQRRRRIGR